MAHPLVVLALAGLPLGRGACLFELRASYRGDTLGHVTLRATPDSAFVGIYHETIGKIERGPAPYGRSRAVYGQRFRILTASGQAAATLGNHTDVVVIWWGGTGCAPMLPEASTRSNVTDLFLGKPPRAESEWIDGRPTYDVTPRDWYYFARRFKDSTASRALAVAEVAAMYERLPVRSADSTATLRATAMLLAWGDEDPVRWTLFPASAALCTAISLRRSLGQLDRYWPPRCLGR